MERIKDLSNIIGLTSTTSMVSNLINSISTISKNIYNLLDLSKNSHTNELIILLERTDIKATIMLLQSVLSELIVDEPYDTNVQASSLLYIPTCIIKRPIVVAIDNVKEIIQIIETELIEIHRKINHNQSLYIVPSLRSYNCNVNLTNMETNISILDKRRDNLFKVIEAFKKYS